MFHVDAKNPIEAGEEIADLWITEMTIFLSTRFPPKGMTLDERKWLAVRSRNFCPLKETLYHKGGDGICR